MHIIDVIGPGSEYAIGGGLYASLQLMQLLQFPAITINQRYNQSKLELPLLRLLHFADMHAVLQVTVFVDNFLKCRYSGLGQTYRQTSIIIRYCITQ